MTRCAAAFLLLLFPLPVHAEAPPRKPRIVLLLADDLGYGHLGCYGQKHIRTPRLDRMASEGMRFTQCYAGCTVCAPSRSVLMTGYHMGHTSVRLNSGGVPLRAEDKTIAEVLKPAGYTCGIFGKWGLGDAGTAGVPAKHGFDEHFGYLHQVHAHSHYPPYLWHNDKKVPLPGNSGNERGLTGDKRGTHSHTAVTEKALDFIRRNKDRPFFCYVPFTLPHVELLAPEEDMKQYRGKFAEKPYVDPRKHYTDQPQPRAAYAAMVSAVDRAAGEVLDLLKSLGIDEETLVLFSSDNGAQGGVGIDTDFFAATGGLRGFKTTMYEGGLRVPMIARWPGKIKAGAVSNQVWYFADMLPTLAELAGVSPPKGIDGLSVVPTLLGEPGKQAQHEYLYWELPQYNAKKKAFASPPMQALRMGNWKVVRPKTATPLELYDLVKDRGETTDVAGEHPEVMRRAEAILKSCRTEPRPQAEPLAPKGRAFQ
jgi:arylsulfatase A-like enzyme